MRNWLVVTTFLIAFSSNAQYNEIGVFGGGTNFLGDVGNQALSLPQGWVAGVSFRHQFDYHYGLRAQASMGTLANNDASSSSVSKQERNLSFQSSIWEVSLMLEINFLQ